jgi:hypothetical protein
MAANTRPAAALAASLLAVSITLACATAPNGRAGSAGAEAEESFLEFEQNHPGTPGASLSFIRVGEKMSHEGKPGVELNIQAVGLPLDRVYFLWQGNGVDAPSRLPHEVKIGKGGYLVPSDGWEPLSLLLHTFARGECQDYVLMSSDGTIAAYGRVIPYPIEAKDGEHHVWVEMLTEYTFAVHGEGFEPGEPLRTTTSIDGDVSTSDSVYSGKGFVAFLALRGHAKGYGRVTYTVEGRACRLSVSFDWGPPALHPGP